MNTVNRWLLNVALAIVVAGSAVQVKAAMCFTEESFLGRMEPGKYYIQDNSSLTYFKDVNTGYSYRRSSASNPLRLIYTFSGTNGLPTGVGGLFTAGTVVTFSFSGTNMTEVSWTHTMDANGFLGYTTDLYPQEMAVLKLTVSGDTPPSRLIFGLDTVMVPEPATILAGALLLLPFAASTVRRLRRDR